MLISMTVFLMALVFVSHFKPNRTEAAETPVEINKLPSFTFNQPKDREARSYPTAPSGDASAEDEGAHREMKEQMERYRKQQRQIKMLKMQFEQINLQLENEKAQTEINKLKRENAGYVKDSGSQEETGFPVIKIIYIGGDAIEKEAIVSIDGTSYSVKPKDRPVSNVEILGISDMGIEIHFSTPHELTTMINYVQE